MKKYIRVLLTLAAAFCALLLVVIFLPLLSDIAESTAIWISIPFIILAAWSTWRFQGRNEIGVISSVIAGAILVGGVSFAIGFFGPMVLVPDANQGPLLGILITGPVGLVVGAIAGFIYWLRDKRGF